MHSLTRSPDVGPTAGHTTIDAAPDRDLDAVEVRGLSVSRGGRPVLNQLDLRVVRGSVTGLLGPSGCGKTTLLRTIVGVQKTEAGRVRVLGTDAGSPALRKRVGYVTQAPSVYADLSVAQNLRYFADVLCAPRTDPARVLEQVGLHGREHDLVGRLSGGQRARVSLAAALLGAPELLVLDEPTVGLDPVLRQELWQLFHHLADHGTTLLVSSHVMDEAERCTRLLLMRDGALLTDDTPAGLLATTGAPDIEQAFLRLVSAPTALAQATDSLDRPAHETEPTGHGATRRRGDPRHHALGGGPVMDPRRTLATARRVLLQLRNDPRTVALMLGVPCLLITLLKYVFDGQPQVFDSVGAPMLGVFPLLVMFVVTAVSTLRERTSGTLERLLTMPLGKLDLLLGYALAFGLVALVQGLLAFGLTVGLLSLTVAGPSWMLLAIAVADGLLGMALGLFVSAFAATEFQAVQFLPAFLLPQLLLCGLFTPRASMAGWLHAVSDALPLSYAVDAMNNITSRSGIAGTTVVDLLVILGCAVVALALGAATLRRRTA